MLRKTRGGGWEKLGSKLLGKTNGKWKKKYAFIERSEHVKSCSKPKMSSLNLCTLRENSITYLHFENKLFSLRSYCCLSRGTRGIFDIMKLCLTFSSCRRQPLIPLWHLSADLTEEFILLENLRCASCWTSSRTQYVVQWHFMKVLKHKSCQ